MAPIEQMESEEGIMLIIAHSKSAEFEDETEAISEQFAEEIENPYRDKILTLLVFLGLGTASFLGVLYETDLSKKIIYILGAFICIAG